MSRRRHNPAGSALPWVIGLGALAGLGFVLYQQQQANAALLAAKAAPPPAQPQPDNTSKDINAATSAGQTLWNDITGLFTPSGSVDASGSINA